MILYILIKGKLLYMFILISKIIKYWIKYIRYYIKKQNIKISLFNINKYKKLKK